MRAECFTTVFLCKSYTFPSFLSDFHSCVSFAFASCQPGGEGDAFQFVGSDGLGNGYDGGALRAGGVEGDGDILRGALLSPAPALAASLSMV